MSQNKLAKEGVQVVMPDTLPVSEYGLLDQENQQPRPTYRTALMGSKFMGTEVYNADPSTPGVDVFAHGLKKKTGGPAVLVVNTSATSASLNLPTNAEQFNLTAGELQTKKIQLNGKNLLLPSDDELPVIKGKSVKAGVIQLLRTALVSLP